MNIIDSIKNELMLLNEKFMLEAEDRYNYWEEHIKYVVIKALDLARKYNADKEIVELAAMLHDIALVAKIGTRGEHHIKSAEIAQEVLQKYNYPQKRIEIVKQCIINHRSSKNSISIEDTCVADADILSHFENLPMLLNSIINNVWNNEHSKKISLPEIRDRIMQSFNHDYNDLSDRTREDFKDRYELICKIVLGESNI